MGNLIHDSYRDLTEADLALAGEGMLEAEDRLRNLMWTVSGDYALDSKIDGASWAKEKYVAMYDAIKQGAFARYFDRSVLSDYIVKKIYYGAEAGALQSIAQVCVDEASYPKVLPDRPGVEDIRARAYESMLEHRFHSLTASPVGRIKLALMRGVLTGDDTTSDVRSRKYVDMIRSLSGTNDTMDLLRVTDAIYNGLIDPSFEKKHGDLAHVLAVTMEELKEFNWKDFMDEEADEDALASYIAKLEQNLSSMNEPEDERDKEPEKDEKPKRRVTVLSEEDIAKMDRYIELTFGKSYLTEQEEKRLNYRVCTGAHCDCRVHYTEGLIENATLSNAQYVSAKRQYKMNINYYKSHVTLVAGNVEIMTAFLKQALFLRTQTDTYRDYTGQIDPRLLWRVGRTPEPGKLFNRTTKVRNNEFVLEILMDMSGSQRKRQGEVALQALIISRALSNVGLPHRIMGFCSFWDYTVMQRFRDYDDPAEKDLRVLQINATANNRDGLAIRAAGESLAQRSEENKILIVLSDGRPNDVTVNRPGARNPQPYFGEYALQDTAFEVRKLRGQGISVLGVFTGVEKDLAAEKKIFGKDFAYVREIRNFSRVVSAYMGRLLGQDV